MSARVCIGVLWLLLAGSVAAQTDAGRPPYSDADWALLPEWCIDTQDGPYGSPAFGDAPLGRNKSPRSDRWIGIFGRDFWHMHHYCRGLYFARQLNRADLLPKDRIAAINRTIGEYQYVVLKATESNPLLPEILYRQGEMYLRKQDRGSAEGVFAAARRIKPDYWPAYTAWIDELMSLRLLDSAAALVSDGLVQIPDNPELLERKRRIDARRGQTGKRVEAPAAPVDPAASAASR